MTAEQLLNMLMTQTFDDFYQNELQDFIIGEECTAHGALSRKDFLINLTEMMSQFTP